MKHDSIKLRKETSYVGTYNDIISAIASGANKVNEIADMVHVEQSVAVHACKHYTLICGVTGKLDYFVTTVGRWWGTHPGKHVATDIDIVGLDKTAKKAVLGECKYRKEPIDRKVYEELLEKDGLISKEYETVQYLLFSKSGFTEWVKDHCDKNRMRLIDLKELYEGKGGV